MKKTVLTALMLFISLFSIAQVSTEKRIEFELKDGYVGERIIEFGEAGFVMRSQKNKPSGSDDQWKYELFDTDLESVKTKEVSIDKKYKLGSSHYTDKYIHTFYKSREGSYIIVSLEVPSLEVTTVKGTLPSNLAVGYMEVIGDYIYFNMYANRRGFLLRLFTTPSEYLFAINWRDSKKASVLTIMEDFNPNRTSIVSMQPDGIHDELMIHAEGKKSKKDREDYMVYFNAEGKKTNEVKLNMEYGILNISTSKINDSQRIVTGTYGEYMYSKGIFFNILDGKNIKSSNAYKFTELENFFSYLPEKRQKKIEKKKRRKERKGKEFKRSYLMAMHDVISLDDGYLLMGEAYYPTYRSQSSTNYVNGQPQTSYTSVFDGYQYTHTTILKFDKAGNKQWDRTFKMWIAHKPFFPKKFIRTTEKNENSIKLVFSTGNLIVSKDIGYDGEILQDYTSEEIGTIHEDDKVKWTSSSVNHWYDNYFITYGRQKLKNKEDKDVKKKRKVLFVSKIKYE